MTADPIEITLPAALFPRLASQVPGLTASVAFSDGDVLVRFQSALMEPEDVLAFVHGVIGSEGVHLVLAGEEATQ